MRTVGPRVVATAATLLALLGASGGMARGDRVVETVYVDPVSYYVPTAYSYVPTSSTYVYPTSYVATTASYVPTSYVATSASYLTTGYSYVPASYTYLPTSYSYLPTSYSAVPAYYEAVTYRRPGLLRRLASRPVYETTRTYAYDAYPTTYYLPTTITYDAPLVTTALTYSGCVESPVPFSPPAPAAVPANTNGAAVDPNATSKSIRSQPRQNEPVYQQPPTNAQPSRPAATPKAVAPPAATPPADAPAFPTESVAPDKSLSPPESPPGIGGSGPGAGAGGTPSDSSTSQTNFRPRPTEMRPRTDVSSQPMLRGEVVSGVNGTPRSGLKVVFTDLRGTYQDRTRTTDANGNFEVFLPNGSWSVQVVDTTAATPKPQVFGQITSTAGRYLDDNDSPIYALKLNY